MTKEITTPEQVPYLEITRMIAERNASIKCIDVRGTCTRVFNPKLPGLNNRIADAYKSLIIQRPG